MITLDGSAITGGGQMIRTALALSAHTNRPFRVTHIRAGRPQPGLRPQHLEAVRAMRVLCNADVEGMHLGSTELTFIPRGFTPKTMDMHIGTAGAISLLLQAFMLPAMHHKKTVYAVHGGTDVRWSPPLEWVRSVFFPVVSAYGSCSCEVKRRGYYPQGGGHVVFTLGMTRDPSPVTFLERGVLEEVRVHCHASQALLDDHVCEDIERSLRVVLGDLQVPLRFQNAYVHARDPGYGVLVYGVFRLGDVRPLISASVLGDEVSSPGEAARIVAERFKERLAAPGAIDEHLADHLVPFMALHGGECTVTRVSPHVRANIAVTERFTGASFRVSENHLTVSRPS